MGPAQPLAEVKMAITVSSTVVAVGASGQDEMMYGPDAAGVNRYQRLRERSDKEAQSGSVSPLVVAEVRSRILVKYGNGPFGEITSAPEQLSLEGAAAKAFGELTSTNAKATKEGTKLR